MLPSGIITVKELILWEYARLISEEASGTKNNWSFNLHNFERLNSDKDTWLKIVEMENKIDPNKCAYCGSPEELLIVRIVPKKMCRLTEIHNIIRSCKKCNLSKGSKDLLDWWARDLRDKIPRNVMARYLKILYICHECNGTMESCAFDKNGNRDISNLKSVFKKNCSAAKTKL